MRVLILGVYGMLGHRLFLDLRDDLEVYGTVRCRYGGVDNDLFPPDMVYEGIHSHDIDGLDRVMGIVGPDVVINCIGMVRDHQGADQPIPNITLNALFPHQLACLCLDRGVRLIHFSTDQVFSGRKPSYTESDIPDPPDFFARAKLLGELASSEGLTIRTSLLGPEIGRRHGIFEKLVADRGGRVWVSEGAVFSGVTTPEMSRAISAILARPEISGIWHVSADPVPMEELFSMIIKEMGLDIEVCSEPDGEGGRVLDSYRFRKMTGFRFSKWQEMVREMVNLHGKIQAGAPPAERGH